MAAFDTAELSKVRSQTKGPVAIVFAETKTQLRSVLEHLLNMQFGAVVTFGPKQVISEVPKTDRVHLIDAQLAAENAYRDIKNAALSQLHGRWVHFCHGTEYLFFPFCRSRPIAEFTSFLEEEQRNHAFGQIIDIYPKAFPMHEDGPEPEEFFLDATGYFANDRVIQGKAMDRQIDIFGGLRWRFEEFVPWERRSLSRIPLLKANGARFETDEHLSEPEMNTVSCPWHHSPTVVLASLRAALYLSVNPVPRSQIDSLCWPGSRAFTFRDQELLDLGFMETGQWF